MNINLVKIFPNLLVALPEKKVLVALIALGCLLLITLFVTIFFVFYSGKKKKAFINGDFNVRVYAYDYVRKRFYCFDKTNLSNTKSFNETEFLAQFRRSDTYRIQDWLSHIVNDRPFPNSLQVDIKISNGKKIVTSLLNFTSINKEKQVVHFESQLLPFMFPQKIHHKKKKVPAKFYLRSEEECKKFFNSANADILGSILYFKLYYNKDVLTPEDEKIINNAKTGILSIVSNYLSKTRRLYQINDYEFLILDTSSLSKLMAMNVATTIHTTLQQYLNFNSPNIDLNIAVGISIGTLFQGNFALGKEQSKKMADAISQGKAKNEKVLIYDENFFISYEQVKVQKDEVRSLIKNSTFRLYFTPTLDIETGMQSFYLLDCHPYGTSLQSFIDVMNLSTDIKSGSETLFEKFIAKVNGVTKSYKEPIKIAVEIPYILMKKFISVATREESNIEWILCARETSILTSNDDATIAMKNLRDFKKSGVKIGIIVDSLSSNLRTRILRQADFFFIPNKFTTKTSGIDQTHNDIRTIQSIYSIFRTPIVFYGLQHIDDIETGIISGGKIFQCDEMALPSSRIEKIDSDTLDFLIDDAKKLAPKRILFEKVKNTQEKEK